MQTTRCDSKGRIYLKEAIRSKYGEQFVVVEEPSEIVLRPLPEDPVKDLEELGKDLRGHSIKEVKRRIRERAIKEALSAL